MELVTARLILRDAAANDALALAAYQSDARYLEFYPERPDAAQIVGMARGWAAETPRRNYQLIVALPIGGVIGCAGVRQAGYPANEGEIGIEIDPDHWGVGYARETLAALIEFARDDLGIVRLFAETTTANVRAHRLVQRLGFLPAPTRGPESRFALALA